MTRILPGVIAMAAVVVASNILVQFLILDGLLTWGAFTYPLAFLVTDVMNRVYGVGPARRVVFIGFIVGIVCSLIGSQIMIQGDGFEFQRLRDGAWWTAPLVSTFVGSTIDTALFFTIAFSGLLSFGVNADAEVSWAQDAVPFLLSGPDAPLWVTLAVADWVPFRLIIGRFQPVT